MSTNVITLTEAEQAEAVGARAYVRSRFYPPLPVEYGDLAVIAVREYREHGPRARVNLPADLNPLPRDLGVDDDGDLYVEAADLIRALRLEHMVADDDDEDEI